MSQVILAFEVQQSRPGMRLRWAVTLLWMRCLRAFTVIVASCGLVQGQPSFVMPAYRAPVNLPVAPGQLLTLFATGINQQINGPQTATTTPWPTTLAGISVTLEQTQSQSYPVPIFSIQQMNSCLTGQGNSGSCLLTEINVQIPYQLDWNRGAGLVVAVNGTPSATFQLQPMQDQIHVLTSCDTVLSNPSPPGGGCTAIVTHGDGTFVSANSPAKNGETVVIYAVGLGGSAQWQTGAPSPNPPRMVGNVRISFDASPNAGPSKPYCLNGNGSSCSIPSPTAVFVGLVPGYVGLYQLNVTIPPGFVTNNTLPCADGISSNLTINMLGATSFDGAPLCVSPGS